MHWYRWAQLTSLGLSWMSPEMSPSHRGWPVPDPRVTYRTQSARKEGRAPSIRPRAIMSCHTAVGVPIPAPRLTRSDPDRSKTMTSWPARCKSAAVAHPAIDPPIMPTLMPAAPHTPSERHPGEVMVIRQFNGVHSRNGLRGTGQTLPVAALVSASYRNRVRKLSPRNRNQGVHDQPESHTQQQVALLAKVLAKMPLP